MLRMSPSVLAVCLCVNFYTGQTLSKQRRRTRKQHQCAQKVKSEKEYRQQEEKRILELLHNRSVDGQVGIIDQVVKFYYASERRKKYKPIDLNAHIGTSAVCLAAYFGDTAVIKALLRYGLPVDQEDTGGNTPLMWAATTKNYELVKLLLERGADPRAKNQLGTTPLHAAYEVADARSSFVIIEALMQKTTSTNEEEEVRKKEGSITWKVLPWCVVHAGDYLRITKNKDDEEYDTYKDLMILGLVNLLLKNPLPQVTIDEANSNGDTALMLALKGKEKKDPLMKLFLKHNASVTKANKEGESPLSVALALYDHELTNRFARQAARLDKNNKVAYGALAWAARYNELVIMRSLLREKDCVVDAQDKEGSSPLLWAINEGNDQAANLLIDAGAGVHITNKHGLSPMHIAAQKGDTKLLALLNRHGTLLEESDEYGWNALITAVRFGNFEAVDSILSVLTAEQKELVNKVDTYKNTPLHIAARFGHVAIVQLLLNHGSNVTLQNKHGWTPLYWAVRNKHAKVVRLLLDHGAKPSMKEEGLFVAYCKATNTLKNFALKRLV